MTVARALAAALLACGLALNAAHAQVYPDRLIKVIVPFTPGSPVDAAARVITQHVQTRLGQSLVVENRPGGGTTIGIKAVMAAPPDGYTLLFIGPNLAYTPVLYPCTQLRSAEEPGSGGDRRHLVACHGGRARRSRQVACRNWSHT